MKPADAVLAVLTSIIWGFAFVATKIALESFSPPQLTALRFLIACLPALLLPRPRIGWPLLILIGLTLFTGQFLLLFFAFTNGLPPGVASVTQQTQAFFTVGLAAVFLGDVPTVRQGVGMAIALVGLVLVGLSVDAELSVLGLALAIGGALSWAVGNVLVKRTGDTPMFALVAWLSLVPPIPALVVAAVDDQHPFLIAQLRAASWTSLAAALYLGAIAQPSPTPFGADCLPAIPPPSWHLSRSLRPAWASPVRRWSLVKCSELFAPSACFSSWPGWRWSCCQPAQRRSCWDGNDEDVPRPRMI